MTKHIVFNLMKKTDEKFEIGRTSNENKGNLKNEKKLKKKPSVVVGVAALNKKLSRVAK
jgi:hypothetical protein